METKIKIRKLKLKDRKTLTRLIKEVTIIAKDESILDKISSTVNAVSEDTETSIEANDNNVTNIKEMASLAVDILTTVLDTVEEETHKWFADLVNVSYDDFLELPVDTELQIIDQLLDASESQSFFTTASHLFKKIKQFREKQ